MKRAPRLAVAFVMLALASVPAGQARAADQRYLVSGRDSFVIGDGDIQSEINYRGTQVLTVTQRGKTTRYVAKVSYVRDDQGAASPATADYTVDYSARGAAIASADHDPDYLTVLNQPFAAQLDVKTLNELRRLRATAPFDVPSPFSNATFHGRLARVGIGMIGPRQALGVRFEAGGPMKGSLPDRPGLKLVGGIVMGGTAYYDLETARLLSLDATVTISGTISNRSSNDPVTIVYRRSLRADVGAPSTEASRR
jgi:hypothetical protein